MNVDNQYLSPSSQAYFNALGLPCPKSKPDLSFLKTMHQAHIANFVFNSLTVNLNKTVLIDSQSVHEKIVAAKLGGYCFEQNKLMFDVLTELGFDVQILMARVLNNKPIDAPRTHRISLVRINNEDYIFDVGFGHYCPRYPIKLEKTEIQPQGNEHFRVLKNKANYTLEILKGDEFFSLYQFDLNHYTEADCLSGNFLSNFFPEAVFVNNLVVSKKVGNDIFSLRNQDYFHIQSGKVDKQTLENAQQLQSLLADVFLIPLNVKQCEALFERYIAPSHQQESLPA